jgi:hypothetical protein
MRDMRPRTIVLSDGIVTRNSRISLYESGLPLAEWQFISKECKFGQRFYGLLLAELKIAYRSIG